MRIGVTCYPTVGGSGAVAAELGKQLAKRGHTVHFVSYRLPFRLGEFQQNISFHAVDVSSYVLFEYPPHDLALAAKMAEVAREHRLDLFHVHYAIPHAITGYLAQQMLGPTAPKLVTTLHGTDVTLVGQDRSFFEITRFGIEKSDGVTAVSDFLRKMTLDEFQIRNGIETIYNFIDLADYCPSRAYKDRLAFAKPEEKILLHISNFRPVKRIMDVVRILERVNRDVPSVLLMVGEGPERSSAQALARRLGLQDRVRFLGTQEGIQEIAAMADVFLLPSELESFGLSALEAMACGVPVIGSDAGGLPEVVTSGETGYLLPVGDVEGMAARAIEILRDDVRRGRMGAAGRKRAEENFGAERIVTQYERYYEKVLGTEKSKQPLT
jgi:N-acetyl-alpha-D-glucosaminyl L-malate synthase BshA